MPVTAVRILGGTSNYMSIGVVVCGAATAVSSSSNSSVNVGNSL